MLTPVRARWSGRQLLRYLAARGLAPTLIAGLLAFAAAILGWRGSDLPAHLYRVGLFHREGLTLWDSQWYGGHWTLDYSVIFPPIAGIIGVEATAAASAALAAWAFDRLVADHFGSGGRLGALLFAIGTLVQVSIGQLPFLLGEALAMGACLASVHRRWRLAALLALATSLSSPLAGAFLGLAVGSWLLASWPARRWSLVSVAGAAAAPVLFSAVFFRGQGRFPFPVAGLILGACVCLGAFLFLPRDERVLRIGARLYAVALAISFFIPSPIGGNIVRLAKVFAIPLAACVLWPYRRVILTVVAIPLVIIQWTPAWGAIVSDSHDPSTHATYFEPLVTFLRARADPPARVEVVPTKLHWEADYVAPAFPLARGWERQLDTADNPLFYTEEALSPQSYHAWLVNNGVRYVALGDTSLDYAGQGEGKLLSTTALSGLRLTWVGAHWRVWEVVDSAGIVSGPGRLTKLDGGLVALQATGPGAVLLRVRYSTHWSLEVGAGCVRAAPDGWTEIDVLAPGPLELRVKLSGQKGAC